MARVMAVFFLGILALGLAQNNAFVGVWEARYNDPNFGPTYVQMVFQPNGSYSQETRTQAGGYVYIPGRYRVVQQGVLRLDIDQRNVYPKEFCGPLGCNPIRYPDGETHYYRFPDRNTLVLQLASCPPGQCVITYRRAR